MQTVTKVNPIRLPARSSLLGTERRQAPSGMSCGDTRGAHGMATRRRGWPGVVGDGMLAGADAMKTGDLPGKAGSRSWRAGSSETGSPKLDKDHEKVRPAEVRVPVVAMKAAKAVGAKGGRKENAR